MKPRLFINIHYLEIGGAETSLIGLLQALDPHKVEVDLFLNEHRGEMMAYIPEWINILPQHKSYSMIERPIKDVIKAGYIHIALARLWAKFQFWFYARKKQPIDGSAIYGFINKAVTPLLPSLKHFGKYDLAIGYLPPYGIVLKKIHARKKICWLHTDYTQIDVNKNIELTVWNKYDNIVSISPDVTTSFLQVFPTLKDKIVEIENFIPVKIIKNKSLEFIPQDMPNVKEELKLLTIGRYSDQKRLDQIPLMAKILKNSGILFRWYIIGYGNHNEFVKIKDQININNVEKEVILLGKKGNPYPYIKACDWYVQPSKYEGKSIAVREAQILCKPVIITAYPTSSSQVKNNINGIILSMDVNVCANAMTTILIDKFIRESIKDSLKKDNVSIEEAEIDKIYNLLL